MRAGLAGDARLGSASAPEAFALELAELVVVAVLSVANVVIGGALLVQPSRWAAAGSPGVQILVAAALGYFLTHLVGVLRQRGALSLVVHHVVISAGIIAVLVLGSCHGYVVMTLVGTSTSILRDLTAMARRGYLRLHRTAVAVIYVVLETIPALALPVQFFAWDLRSGELPALAIAAGVVAFPIASGVGLIEVGRSCVGCSPGERGASTSDLKSVPGFRRAR